MPINYTQLSSALDRLQANAAGSVNDVQVERENFSQVLDEVEVGKTDVINRAKAVTENASRMAAGKFDEYNNVQRKIVEAGPFHDIVALFTGAPTKEDLVEEQQRIALETRQIANHEDYQKALLAQEDNALNTKLQFAQSRLAIKREGIADASQLMQTVSQSLQLRQTAATNFIANQYSLSEMKQFIAAGTVPPEYKGMGGLFESIYYEKLRAARLAMDTGKDTRTEVEKLVASFDNDANAIAAQVETATQGFITAPNGARFDLNLASKYVNDYRTNFATAMNFNSPTFTGLQNNFTLADQQAEQLSGIARRAPGIAKDPNANLALQAHAAQYDRFAKFMTDVQTAPPEQQQTAIVAAAGPIQKLVTGQQKAIDEIGKLIESQYGSGDVGKIAAQWATTGSIASKNIKASGDFYLASYLENVTPSQRQAAGGLLLGDVFNSFTTALNTEVEKTLKSSGDKSFVNSAGRIDQGALLQSILAGKDTLIPNWQIINSVVQQKNDNGSYVWENAIKGKYIESIVSAGFSELRDSFPALRAEFDRDFKDAINPVTRLLTYKNLDEFINALTIADQRLHKEGKLQPQDSLVDVFRQIVVPKGELSPTTTFEVTDAKWNRMFDAANSQVGPGGQLLVYQMFKGTEKSQVAQSIMQLFDKSVLTAKSYDQNLADATETLRSITAARAKDPSRVNKQKPKEAADEMRQELLKSYPPEVVDEALKRAFILN